MPLNTSLIFGSIVRFKRTHAWTNRSSGESYRGRIEIKNTADTEKSVRILLRDHTFNYLAREKEQYDSPGTIPRFVMI